jgi:hypothetical protein
MRIGARNTPFTVTTAPDSAHPIRMRTSIAVFMLDLEDEAVSLATELADAATELNHRKDHP